MLINKSGGGGGRDSILSEGRRVDCITSVEESGSGDGVDSSFESNESEDGIIEMEERGGCCNAIEFSHNVEELFPLDKS